MGVVTAIGLGVAAAGAAAAAAAKKRASDKAASAQKKGIEQQKTILKNRLSPEVLNDLAQRADAERARSRLALQQEIDPELAQLRQRGKEQLLAQANIPEESKQSTQLANRLFEETQTQDPRLEALRDSILSRAQEEINAGATLPPEFQGELVRAGLQQGSGAGISLDQRSVGGGVARALGLAGIQLQQQRQQEATRLANEAQRISEARVNMLSTVFPKLRDLETIRRQEAAQAFGIGKATLPESGLSGQDQVNIEIAKNRGLANLANQRAAVSAQQAIAQGQFTSELIGAGTSLVGGAAGAIGGAGAAGGITNLAGVGGTGASVNIGNLGSRTPAQQRNFDFLQSYYS